MSNDLLAERIRARPEEMTVDFILPSAATTTSATVTSSSSTWGVMRGHRPRVPTRQ